jgi:hypothetical protein
MSEDQREKIEILKRNKKLWKFLYKKGDWYVFLIKNYITRYNPKTGEYSCTCKGFTFNKECYHVKFVKEIVKKLEDIIS